MAIVVNSPHSGKPVKVRDQDVSRAVRDEEGRVFYVLPLSDGSGYYGSVTRVGGEREEARYQQMSQKTQTMKSAGAEQSQKQVHDAMGKRRGNRRLVLLVVVVAAAAALAWAVMYGPLQGAVPLGGANVPTAPAAP